MSAPRWPIPHYSPQETADACRRTVPWLDWEIEGSWVVGTGDLVVCLVEPGRTGRPWVRSVAMSRPHTGGERASAT